MDKGMLRKLALVGLAGGIVAGCGGGSKEPSDSMHKAMDDMQQAAGMSEADLLGMLDDRHQALYESLDEDHKALAQRMAAMTCAGQNECAGLNSCKGPNNECAGMGSCKGQGGCGFKDKNMVIRLAAKHMRDKRGQIDY